MGGFDLEEFRVLLQRYDKYKDDKTFLSNEKQVCQSLIVPLIGKVLHWETDEPSEFKTEVSQAGKRIDYVVCSQGISQFIVEAKAPNEEMYSQAVSYGYGKDRDFAILTNFRQLVILGCKIRARSARGAELARIDLLTASQKELGLLGHFEREFWLSSGRSNPLYALLGAHKPSIPLDEQLLEDLKEWRSSLLTNIRQHPRQNRYDFGDEHEFMHVEEEVQRLINRLIFICFCEDKELKDPVLKGLLEEKKGRFALKPGWLLGRVKELFGEYRREYDSDLFDRGYCDDFFIEDARLLDILEDLRQPKDRPAYDFKSIEADILGKSYENFIGHVQRGKKRFKEEEDRGKRKSEGIYYTPKFIVDYIVNNTVRPRARGKAFEDILSVKILDPACGSGSFLLRAYDVLLEEAQRSLGREPNYDEKRKLMLSCIHGVDVDERAIEIAKLSLSLRLASRGERLPQLRENIRLGNSLIDDKKIADYKAFAWEEEFRGIMGNGGFDVVVGNPPWGADIDDILDYLKRKYPQTTQEHKDIYKCFIERAMTLLRTDGTLGYIVPNTCLLQPRYKDVRIFLKQYLILKVINLGERVFEGVEAPSCIIVVRNRETDGSNRVKVLDLAMSKSNEYKSQVLASPHYSEISQDIYDRTVDNNFVTFFRELKANEKLFGKIVDCRDAGINYQRVGVGLQEKGNSDLAQRLLYENPKQKNKQDKEYLKGEDIERYWITYKTGRFVRTNYKEFIKSNEVVRLDIKTYEKMPKLLWRQTADRPIVTIDDEGAWFGRSVQAGILIDDNFNIKYLLALLNSRYLSYLYIQSVKELGRVFPQVKLNKIKQLPIKIISPEKQKPFIIMAEKMLSLNKKLGEEKLAQLEKQKLEQEVKKTDSEIDNLVYSLYNITEEERRIIEQQNQ
ncbi:N-6 DNA methylase [Candidatus Woesearchaeota archaeon]|nr:N-6 DNA methylase [Candidatus Woesearchaeota archaeon]